MATNRLAFIMAGGSGERFWPLSRANRPKQLLRLTDPKRTLLQEAIERIEPLIGLDSTFVITSRLLQTPIQAANVVPLSQVWAEPAKRNTLGALVWVAATLIAQGKAGDAVAILTADHKIADETAFRSMVDRAMTVAETTGGLVTCGIVPTRPETGYGYIEVGEKGSNGFTQAKSFREKPNLETAQSFVDSKLFLWNSGMFFWKIDSFASELKEAHPDAYQILVRIAECLLESDIEGAAAAYESLPSVSIDFALMERAKNVYVVEAGFGWDDVGAWDAIPRAIGADEDGNLSLGDCAAIDCKNTLLYNESTLQTLTAVGTCDVIAVATDDAILVCPMDQAQRVKDIVEFLKKENRDLI